MKKIIETILPTSLAALLGFVASPFLREIWDFAADIFLPRLSNRGHLSLLATLTIICLALGTLLYFSTSHKRLLRQYSHDEKSGVSRHRKNGTLVCTSCLRKDYLESPLKVGDGVWFCQVVSCRASYENPRHKARGQRSEEDKSWQQVNT